MISDMTANFELYNRWKGATGRAISATQFLSILTPIFPPSLTSLTLSSTSRLRYAHITTRAAMGFVYVYPTILIRIDLMPFSA